MARQSPWVRSSAQKKAAARKAAKTPPKSGMRKVAPQPYLRLGFLVHDVSRMRRTLFDQAVKPLGITRSQWSALASLSRHEPDGMIQSDLARLLDVGKVTVGGLIERLEASGYVERKPDDGDRRIKRIYITGKGYDVIDQMVAAARELNDAIMADIPLDQIHIAEDVMHQMKENLRRKLGVHALNDDRADAS